MNTSKNDIELIKAYLNNQMSEAERHSFEVRLLDDPFLEEALEGFESDSSALTQIDKIEGKNPYQFKFSWLLLLGAMITILVVVVLVKESASSSVIKEEKSKTVSKRNDSVDSTTVFHVETKENDFMNENESSEMKVQAPSQKEKLKIDSLKTHNVIPPIHRADTKLDTKPKVELGFVPVRKVDTLGPQPRKLAKDEIDISPYLAFSFNYLKFQMVTPMSNKSVITKSNGKPLKEREIQRHNEKIDVALQVLTAIEAYDEKRFEVALNNYEGEKDFDNDMYDWFRVMMFVQQKKYDFAAPIIDRLAIINSKIGIQSQQLQLEMKALGD